MQVVQAQKFGYVDSEYILSKIPAYSTAQQELNTLSTNWQKDIESQKKDLDKMYRTYQAERAFTVNKTGGVPISSKPFISV